MEANHLSAAKSSRLAIGFVGNGRTADFDQYNVGKELGTDAFILINPDLKFVHYSDITSQTTTETKLRLLEVRKMKCRDHSG